jgi:hypothetical protein
MSGLPVIRPCEPLTLRFPLALRDAYDLQSLFRGVHDCARN